MKPGSLYDASLYCIYGLSPNNVIIGLVVSSTFTTLVIENVLFTSSETLYVIIYVPTLFIFKSVLITTLFVKSMLLKSVAVNPGSIYKSPFSRVKFKLPSRKISGGVVSTTFTLLTIVFASLLL